MVHAAEYFHDKLNQELGAVVQLGNLQIPVVILSWTSFCLVFHVFAACFALIDHELFVSRDLSRYLLRFKVSKIGMKNYWNMLPLVLFNQLFVMLPCMLAFTWYGFGFHEPAYRSIVSMLYRTPLLLGFLSIGHDIIFYLGHRFILHTSWGIPIFRHDIHHRAKASSAISALYMHPLDFFLEVVLPFLIPFALVSNLSSSYLNILMPGIAALGGCYEHSGFNFWPNVTGLDTRLHISHHARWNVSFSDGVGSANLMDSMFGTAADVNALHTSPNLSLESPDSSKMTSKSSPR